MATVMTPVTSLPLTNADISGSVAAGAPMIRLSGTLTSGGADDLVLIRRNSTGYWERTAFRLKLTHRGTADFEGASGSVDIPVNDTASYHVLSTTGNAVSAGAVTLENLAPSIGVALPGVAGDNVALLAATQSLLGKTLVSPVVSTGLTASGSAGNDFSASTGPFKTSTGAVTVGGGAAAIGVTSSGAAVTITAGAASTFSVTSGALSLSGAAGVNLKYGATVLLDAGVTSSTKVTVGANIDLTAAAGTTALSLGSATGATQLPTGNLAWAGASTKTVSIVCTAAAMTLTAAATSVWSTTTGNLTLDAAAVLNLGTANSTSQTAGKSGTIWTFAGKVAAGATAALIADPGNAGAIAVTADGVCALTTAGAETRTLAIPTYVGQRLTIVCDTYVGNAVVTVASAFDSASHTLITLGAAGKSINLVGVTVGGTRAWRLAYNDGCTLG